MEATPLDIVLNHPAIWRGNDCAHVVQPSVPTGHAELDVLLPGGGWPAGALTEISVERPGIGELQLLMPALARLTRAGRWMTLIAPPHIPYAPALLAHGVRLSHLLLVRPQVAEERAWACEQVLHSACCGAVLMWVDRIEERTIRRLQLAAERGGALVMLLRPGRVPALATAALRIHVSKTAGRTIVRILKRRGGGMPAPVALDLHGKPSAHSSVRHPAPTPACAPVPLH